MALDLSSFYLKLKALKRSLKTLNRDNFSKIQERVSEATGLLKLAQIQALNQPSQQSFQAERDMHDNWKFLSGIEESYFQQKSSVNWLSVGDQNTSYFLRTAEMRNSYNAIRSFSLDDDTII